MSLRSFVYFLVSVIVLTVGVVLLLASRVADGTHLRLYDPVWLSIATGLISAGVTSLVFTVVREIDQRDAAQASKRLDSLIQLERDLHQGLTQLRRALLLARDPDARRIFTAHPVHEVGEELDDAVGAVQLDGLGLTLKGLYDDQVKTKLIQRRGSEVRLLAMDPCSDAFAIMCEEEARGLLAMTQAVVTVTEDIRALAAQGDTAVQQGASVLIKWSSHPAPVSITRVNDWMAVRIRFPQEAAGERAFYEQYTDEDKAAFSQFERLFARMWGEAKEPTVADLQRARTRLDALGAKRRQDGQA